MQKAEVQAGEQQRVRRRKGRDSRRSEGGRKTGRQPQRWPTAANLSPCLAGTEQRRTNSLASAKLDNEEKEPEREKGNTKRKDASRLYFSSAVSLLACALVDHGRKQVNAAALLLWALVADRYNLISYQSEHGLVLWYVLEFVCIKSKKTVLLAFLSKNGKY